MLFVHPFCLKNNLSHRLAARLSGCLSPDKPPVTRTEIRELLRDHHDVLGQVYPDEALLDTMMSQLVTERVLLPAPTSPQELRILRHIRPPQVPTPSPYWLFSVNQAVLQHALLATLRVLSELVTDVTVSDLPEAMKNEVPFLSVWNAHFMTAMATCASNRWVDCSGLRRSSKIVLTDEGRGRLRAHQFHRDYCSSISYGALPPADAPPPQVFTSSFTSGDQAFDRGP